MKHYTYTTEGTCSQAIEFDLDDEQRIHGLCFIGGCPGNTIGIAKMAEGQPADEIARKLRGLTCGVKRTSCPDQLARALENAVQNIK